MSVDKISPTDPRVKKDFKEVNGRKWYYWDAAPKGEQRGTVFLVHGYPDISLGWRYQIPMLTEMGLRVLALDSMGYSDTGFSPNLKDYTYKSHADAIAGIAKQIGAPHIAIGGHDWGGAAVWRVAQWYPDLVTHVFSVCTPYFKVFDQYTSTETLVKNGIPQFGYQLQFGSDDRKLENAIVGEKRVRNWLKGMYGGRTKSGKAIMTPTEGVDLSMIENEEIGMTPLLTEEELDYYVKEYLKSGLEGPCNWYRTRKVNHEDDVHLPADQKSGIKQPALFVQATKDFVLTDDLTRGMSKSIPNLTWEKVEAGHWALSQTPAETNAIIKKWFEGVVFGGKTKL